MEIQFLMAIKQAPQKNFPKPKALWKGTRERALLGRGEWDSVMCEVVQCWALCPRVNINTNIEPVAPPWWTKCKHQVRATNAWLWYIPQVWLTIPLGVITSHPLKIPTSSLNWIEYTPSFHPVSMSCHLAWLADVFFWPEVTYYCMKAIL